MEAARSVGAPSESVDRGANAQTLDWEEVFVCPESGEALRRDRDALVSPKGRRWPIVDGVPRFVSGDLYVGSFSFEWKVHKRTQLDSATGSTDSEGYLIQKTGLSPEQVAGKRVLDAGVGVGRFAEILSRWGAQVVGVDLSYAIESAQENLGDDPNVLLAQADIGKLPFRLETFDLIVSIGVLHHTSDTREHFLRLTRLLKPGGEIAIWVYPNAGDYQLRSAWIPFTNRIPERWFYDWCKVFVPWARRNPKNPLVRAVGTAFPFSQQDLGIENDILDTFDGFSPRFHGVHSEEEVEGWFREAGLEEIRRLPFPTAVRGRRPQAQGAKS